MTIVQIAPQSNGAHANQTTVNPLPEIPEGWAVVPEGLEIPDTFPFVDITAGKITVDPDTQPVSVGEEGQLWVVTSMTPGAVPEPAPEPEPDRPAGDEHGGAGEQLKRRRSHVVSQFAALDRVRQDRRAGGEGRLLP